ncbi:hypothetical protein WMY93_019822 [Mugilogobius chulae]|uniref:Uncharacterized protein n=1 Tax=Mugilogobius chulae TaxID=88201 RepID=A0AAW0NSL2_9GOBI
MAASILEEDSRYGSSPLAMLTATCNKFGSTSPVRDTATPNKTSPVKKPYIMTSDLQAAKNARTADTGLADSYTGSFTTSGGGSSGLLTPTGSPLLLPEDTLQNTILSPTRSRPQRPRTLLC